MQVRPGTGGEEASLFALDLWGMYQRFAALQGWRFEVMHLTFTEAGGCKHGSAAISGMLQSGVFVTFHRSLQETLMQSEAASTAAPQQIVVTSAGHWRGEGLGLVEAVRR